MYNFASGVNFCGQNFFRNVFFLRMVEKPHQLEPAKISCHGMLVSVSNTRYKTTVISSISKAPSFTIIGLERMTLLTLLL